MAAPKKKVTLPAPKAKGGVKKSAAAPPWAAKAKTVAAKQAAAKKAKGSN